MDCILGVSGKLQPGNDCTTIVTWLKQRHMKYRFVCRPALFMCQADGSLAIQQLEGSSLGGQPHWVQPKTRTQALGMVLLGADGAPLYPQQAHLQLTWPHNNMITVGPAGGSPSGQKCSNRTFVLVLNCLPYNEGRGSRQGILVTRAIKC